nr:serine/threonine-protein kinase [uncultured Roseateles sp.]
MSPESLKRVSALWDALSALPETGREDWFASLPPDDAVHATALREMLRHAQAPSDGLSRGLPPMTGQPYGFDGDVHLPDAVVGPYRLLRLLGRGGMGEVWLARRDDGLLSREVAVKLPLLAGQQALRQRFERERDILASLIHPHIARLYDAGIAADGQPFMALEFVEGEPLTAYCDRRQLAVDARVALFLQVLEAVQYAHSRLVIHRDLKPSNILVTAQGEVRLLDFGIAKLLDQELTPGDPQASELTRAGGLAMTLDYASPEQILQQPVGTLSDVYSLGVLLCELLSGERPYRLHQHTRRELETAILEDTRPLPSSLVDEAAAALRGASGRGLARQLQGDLDTITLKALKPVPAERYATVDALAQDLQRWRSGQPVAARPDSRWYRTQRFVRRNALAVAASALLVAGLSGGLGVALWQARIARIETQIARATEAFLTGLFEANSLEQDDPVRAQLTTARELLGLGAQRIVSGLDDAPEARLRVLQTLAGLHQGLSLDDEASSLQLQRLRLFEQLHPEPGAALGQELIAMALAAHASAAHVGEAAAYLQRAEATLNGLGEAGSLLQGRLELAKATLADGDMCVAAGHAQRGVALLRQQPASAELVEGLLLESQSQSYCGNQVRAVAAGEEAVQLMGRLQQKRKLPDAYATMSVAEMSLGHMARSFVLGRQALDTAEAQHPRDTTPGATVMNAVAHLAVGLVACGQPADALAMLEPRLKRALADLPHTDRDAVVSVLLQRARAQLALGDAAAALASLREADRLMASFEVEDGQRVMYLDALAAAWLADGRPAQAQHTLDQGWALHQRLHHTGSTQINVHMATRIRYRLAAGQVEQARADLAHYLPRRLPSGQVSRSELEQHVLAAEIAVADRQWDEGLKQAGQALADIAKHPEPRYVRDLQARAALASGAALQGQGRTAEAQQQRSTAAALFKAMAELSL